jgi:hypothetical protein
VAYYTSICWTLYEMYLIYIEFWWWLCFRLDLKSYIAVIVLAFVVDIRGLLA